MGYSYGLRVNLDPAAQRRHHGPADKRGEQAHDAEDCPACALGAVAIALNDVELGILLGQVFVSRAVVRFELGFHIDAQGGEVALIVGLVRAEIVPELCQFVENPGLRSLDPAERALNLVRHQRNSYLTASISA